MEHIQVMVPGKEGDDIDVLINGEKNGKVGEVIVLGGSGFVIISVDLAGAQELTIDVENTTASNPMIIKVNA